MCIYIYIYIYDIKDATYLFSISKKKKKFAQPNNKTNQANRSEIPSHWTETLPTQKKNQKKQVAVLALTETVTIF